MISDETREGSEHLAEFAQPTSDLKSESGPNGRLESPSDQPRPELESAPIDGKPPPQFLPVVEVRNLNWEAAHTLINPTSLRARMPAIIERMEQRLDQASGPEMLFDRDRGCATDKAIHVTQVEPDKPLWFVGDLHGDWLALESILLLIQGHNAAIGANSRIIFLGDLFDDEGFGLEVLVRVFEIAVENPTSVCIIAGNHDESLGFDGQYFTSAVSPSDFCAFLNSHIEDEWIARAGKLAIRLFALAPRALFFPDGLLVAHGGFPLSDLQGELQRTGDWNHPDCLSDFVWTRAHPRARKKLPNRFTRGCQFGYEDFAAFCSLAATLGRPVTHMVRGHDHVEERFAVYPAYYAHPILTTNALCRRLPRELSGPHERSPTAALYVEGSLPHVFRLHVPAELIHLTYPEAGDPMLPEDESKSAEA